MTIRNNATRPFPALHDGRRPRSIIGAQGQVVLDIDLNAGGDIAAARTETEALDLLGPVAVPLGTSGFQIGTGGTISAGRLYLDGLLVENPADTTLTTQPHPAAPLPQGPAVIGLKALVRHVDPVEDRNLVDKALADATTSGRGLVDWQVFAVPVALEGGTPLTCEGLFPPWFAITTPSNGRLAVGVDPGAAASSFCSPAISGGYTRLENVLYRIEVDGGKEIANFPPTDGPRFGVDGLRLKLSRRNASVMTRIVAYAGRQLTVDPPALDTAAWFMAGGVAEIVSVHDDVDQRAASGQVRLFSVAAADDASITLGGVDALPLPASNALGTDWYLRLWDTFPDFALSATAAGAPVSASIDCGDGVQMTVQGPGGIDPGFIPPRFRRGDFWNFTARIDGTIDWPVDGAAKPVPRPPDGPVIHYAKLAVVSGPAAAPIDCRPAFLPQAQQLELQYHGGDGQAACLTDSAAPFVPLRDQLRVAVLRGGLPIPNIQIRWSSPPGVPPCQVNGLAPPMTAATDASGLAAVSWALDRTQPDAAHALQAELVLPPGGGSLGVAPIHFGASFTTARRTSYQPGCALLASTATVQDALDLLCANVPASFDTLLLKQITLLPKQHNLIVETEILNGIEVTADELAEGVRFEVDRGPIEQPIQPDDPIVDLVLDLPFPVTNSEADGFGHGVEALATLPVRLDGTVRINQTIVDFVLAPATRKWLTAVDARQFGPFRRPRICARLRLRSQWIWIKGAHGPVYLNAAHLAVPGGTTRRELGLRERDPRRAGDLDMFFFLTWKG